MLCDALSRVRFAFLPTPLEEVGRLTRALGGPRIFFKREDQAGLSAGGNKTRLYEYAMGDVLREGCDAVIAAASAQSNKMREAAAAASKLGLKCVLLAPGKPPAHPQGNMLLFHLLGADVRFIPEAEASGPALMKHFEAVAEELRAEGRKPYILDRNLAYGAYATAAYIAAAEELWEQCQAQHLAPDYVYITTGAGMTTAGLALGLKHLGAPTRVVGISAGSPAESIWPNLLDYAQRAGELVGIPTRLERADLDLHDGYVGSGYGEITEGCLEAMTLTARAEGILLDPVYTGKTFSALIDHVRAGKLTEQHTVVFVHTGGVPALYAYADELAPKLLPG